MTSTVRLNGTSLTRTQLVAIANTGLRIELDTAQLEKVQRTADFLSEQVKRGEPIYGVTTGFGSNADKLLGAHRARDELPGGNPEKNRGTLLEELQHNLVVTHAVCVGKPLAVMEVIAAMCSILPKYRPVVDGEKLGVNTLRDSINFFSGSTIRPRAAKRLRLIPRSSQ